MEDSVGRHLKIPGLSHRSQVMAPLNQNPVPWWYYPVPSPDPGMIVEGPLVKVEGSWKIIVMIPPSEKPSLAGATVPVMDGSGCILDEEDDILSGTYAWARWAGPILQWVLFNRCCTE